MKYITRILAFLFISFVSVFGLDIEYIGSYSIRDGLSFKGFPQLNSYNSYDSVKSVFDSLNFVFSNSSSEVFFGSNNSIKKLKPISFYNLSHIVYDNKHFFYDSSVPASQNFYFYVDDFSNVGSTAYLSKDEEGFAIKYSRMNLYFPSFWDLSDSGGLLSLSKEDGYSGKVLFNFYFVKIKTSALCSRNLTSEKVIVSYDKYGSPQSCNFYHYNILVRYGAESDPDFPNFLLDTLKNNPYNEILGSKSFFVSYFKVSYGTVCPQNTTDNPTTFMNHSYYPTRFNSLKNPPGICGVCPTGSYLDSKTGSCISDCKSLSNHVQRFDCSCNSIGYGSYVSNNISFDDSGWRGNVKCENGVLDSDYFYSLDLNKEGVKKYITESDLPSFSPNGYDLENPPTLDGGSGGGSVDGGGSGGGTSSSGGGSSGGGEQGGTQPSEPEVDVSDCENTKSAIISSIQNYNRIYRDAGIDCSNSEATVAGRDMKRSLESRISNFNSSKCAEKIGAIDYTISAISCKTDPSKPDPVDPPAPQEPSKETISYNENTNTVTITDPNTGKTQTVTPTETNKNNKGEMQTIKYTDPETGKTIEYKAKEDGTWERIEHEGQGGTGTNPSDKEPGTGTGEGKPGGSSEGEGAGDSEDGKKDGKDDGDGNFEGGELGALGDSNDFDKGGELAGLMNSNDDLDDENDGIVDSLFTDGFSILDDFTKSLDNVKEMAEDLKDNPFSSSNVVSCAIDLNILDQSSQIDLCKYTSQFKPLFSSIFFVFLNIFIGWAFFRVLMIALLNF